MRSLCVGPGRCLCVWPSSCLCALPVRWAYTLPALCPCPSFVVRAACLRCVSVFPTLCALLACAVRTTLALLRCSSYAPVRSACALCVLPSEARTSDRVATKFLPTTLFPPSPNGRRANPWDFVSFGQVWEGLTNPPPLADVDALIDLFFKYSDTCFSNCHRVTSLPCIL